MLKIVVCDDDSKELTQMEAWLSRFHHSVASIDAHYFSYSKALFEDLKTIETANVFLLDIVMPDVTGIELATKIRTINKEAIIIFLTSSRDYALDAYGLKAMYYLLKPVLELELFEALNHAQLVCDKRDPYYSIQTRTDLISVKISEIKYVEYRDHFLYFAVSGRIIKSKFYRMPFEEAIQSLFDNEAFVLSHRSYLINMNHVQRMGHDGFTMDDQTFIPISKNRVAQVKKIYLNYGLRG